MSPRIKELPQDLIDQIAAGEVVERPSSVLKELVENSIDAGATEITVTIEGAGRTRLVVSDNGSGMSQKEALLALKRHATSKISQFDDLYSLSSYGFRGEALPSIASVSRFRLASRNKESDVGWEIEIEGGKVLAQKPIPREKGTTIEVRDLFFNTPARFKFLKADSTERGHCIRVIEELAFATPHITLTLLVEKNKPLVFRRANDLKKRVIAAWGSKWESSLTEVNADAPHMKLSGWVTHPNAPQATSRYQLLFINGRAVTNRRVAKAVYEAYRGQLPSMRHPGWVLKLDVNPAAVDVNVHPTKREVKLTFENEIFGFVMKAIQKSLSPRSASAASVPVFSNAPPQPSLSHLNDVYRPLPKYLPSSFSSKEAEPILKDVNPLPMAEEKVSNVQVKAQVGNLYLLCESDDGFIIVDQHAAHEKIIYENLFKNLNQNQADTQMLLVPFTWEVALSLVSDLKGRIQDLEKMGYLIEPFGDATFVVKGIPRTLGEKYNIEVLLDAVSDLFGEAKSENFIHKLAAMTACKAAVKAGDPLENKEGQQLVEDLFKIEAPFTCPHGRPTFIRTSLSELNRKFARS